MRYFLEVAYKGTKYAGFQIQNNAATIQGEIERALSIVFRRPVALTGSSRTDAGVHAYQNYFHTDVDFELPARILYNLNSVLPADITVKSITPVQSNAHCRFDAVSREYTYYIYSSKNPFLTDIAWFYPYTLNFEALQQAASIIMDYLDFTSFSKRNTQTHTNLCSITKSAWTINNECIVYNVVSNRFLRGMVRGLVGTMLQVGRGAISLQDFRGIIEVRDCTKADFSTPSKGLFLTAVNFPDSIYNSTPLTIF